MNCIQDSSPSLGQPFPGLYDEVEIGDNPLDLTALVLHKNNRLGGGNFGRVYRGTIGDRQVAVKVIKPPKTSGLDLAGKQAKEKAMQEFDREIATWQKLPQHENVAKLLGVVDKGGLKCVVMPLYRGGSLKEELDKSRIRDSVMKKRKSLSILLAIAQGLKHLHENHIVHRDLAARNVLFGKEDLKRVVIADFGLSREVGWDRAGKDYYAMAGASFMAIAWLAPETLVHNKSSAKSDVWSFGVVVWEVVTRGLTPFPNLTTNQISALAGSGELRNMLLQNLEEVEDADPDMVNLAEMCLIPDPVLRPSISEVAEKISGLLSKP